MRGRGCFKIVQQSLGQGQLNVSTNSQQFAVQQQVQNQQRSVGYNQHDQVVLDYVRWVMVRKRDPGSAPTDPVIPELPEAVAGEELNVPAELNLSDYDDVESFAADRVRLEAGG